MWTCDKCDEVVDPKNDAVDLDFIMQRGRRPEMIEKFVYGARHLLPTDSCEGSPSRAQYITGVRDTRPEYPYIPEREKEYRDAHAELSKFGQRGLR